MSKGEVLSLVEHLPRIGTTSVSLEGLHSPKISRCEGRLLEAADETGKSITILLPTEVVVDDSLKFRECGLNCYSLRLKSRPQDLVAYQTTNKAQNIIMSLPEGKWSKKDLVKCEKFEMRCISCQLPIIAEENCNKLNELPSEFWMELMDYWHCHKPHQPSQEIWYSTKYNSLQPAIGEVVIGGSFFLGQPQTFEGRIKSAGGILECIKCSAVLGDETKDHLFKVRKWQVSLNKDGKIDDLFPPEQDVVFTLLNLLKGYSTRYILLKSGETQLMVWLFAVDLDVTLANNKVLKNCIKVLYRSEMPESDMKKLNVERVEVERLPMQRFIESLQVVNKMLPSNSQSFKLWRVGYATFTDQLF